MESPSMNGVRACHKWLSYCLSIGWPRETLKGLADLFWQHHDRDGRLTMLIRLTPTDTIGSSYV